MTQPAQELGQIPTAPLGRPLYITRSAESHAPWCTGNIHRALNDDVCDGPLCESGGFGTWARQVVSEAAHIVLDAPFLGSRQLTPAQAMVRASEFRRLAAQLEAQAALLSAQI